MSIVDVMKVINLKEKKYKHVNICLPQVLLEGGAGGVEIKLFDCIQKYSKKFGYCEKSTIHLLKKVGCCEKVFVKAMQKLKNLKVIYCHRFKRNGIVVKHFIPRRSALKYAKMIIDWDCIPLCQKEDFVYNFLNS
ncbi:hypothetical protein KY321_03980 [Candidatus Woesearchaeota archaeon]|nr:hypothetical protein [Candidatus Woesearchaeota archaeon]